MARTIFYMHIWLSGVLAICIKQVFSYVFIKTFLIIKLVPLIETSEPVNKLLGVPQIEIWANLPLLFLNKFYIIEKW